MSDPTINLGSQVITFDYLNPATGASFNTILRGGIVPGIYQGGLMTPAGAATISIAPFVAYLNVGTDKMIRVETFTAVVLAVSSATPVISITYDWDNIANNWLSFEQRSVAAGPITNEVCLGECVFTGPTITSSTYIYKNWGSVDNTVGNARISNDLYVGNDILIDEVSLFNYIATYHGSSYVGLLVKRNASHPDHQVDISWTELYVEGRPTGARSLTIDITASGALGLDTSTESANAWYYIWILTKADGTVTGVFSASSTSPTLPSGYTRKRLVSMVRNTSGDFVDFVQQDKIWGYATLTTAYSTTSTTLDTGTARDLTIYIPELVTKIKGSIRAYGSKSGSAFVLVATLSGYINGIYITNTIAYGEATTSLTAADGASFEIITNNRYIKTQSDGSTASPSAFGITVYFNTFEVPL